MKNENEKENEKWKWKRKWKRKWEKCFGGESGCGSSKGVVKSGKYENQTGSARGQRGALVGIGKPKMGRSRGKREKTENEKRKCWVGSGCGSSKDVVKSGKYKTHTEWRLTGGKKKGGGREWGEVRKKRRGRGEVAKQCHHAEKPTLWRSI